MHVGMSIITQILHEYPFTQVLNCRTLVSVYYSFIFHYLLYCIEIWGGAVITYKDVLIKLQKKIVRTMVSASYNAHTTPNIKQEASQPDSSAV